MDGSAGPVLAGVFLLVGAAALAGLAPTASWLDAGELVAASWALGLAHPPGEVGWILPGRLLTLLPVGSIAFRLGLLSAVAAAASATLVAALTAALLDLVEVDAPEGIWLSGLLAGSGALYLQATRPEVYALQQALMLAALLCLIRRRPGALALAGGLLGVAAVVHPLLAVLALPAVIVAAGPGLPSEARLGRLGLPVGAGLLSLGMLLYLPVRAQAAPELAWGLPDVWERFVGVVSAEVFRQNFAAPEAAPLSENLVSIAGVLGGHGLLALLLPALAGWAWLVARGARSAAAALGLFGALSLASVLTQNKVFEDNPDLHGYLLPFVAFLQIGGGLGLSAVGHRARQMLPAGEPVQRLKLLLVGLAIAASGAALLASHIGHSQRLRWEARQLARTQLEIPPWGSTLLVRGNDATFLGLYLRHVEGLRPDLAWVPRPLLGHAHYMASAQRTSGGRPGGLRLDQLQRGLGLAWEPSEHPLFLELRPWDLPYGARLTPLGPLTRLGPHAEPLGWSEVRRHQILLARALPDEAPTDPYARAAISLLHGHLAELWSALGRDDLARGQTTAGQNAQGAGE